MYKKIYKTFVIMAVIILAAANILFLTVSYTALTAKEADLSVFKWIAIGGGVSMVLILGLCTVFARNLTADIIKPLDNPGEKTYPELEPYLNRISGQSAEINHQMERVNRQRLRLQTVGDNMSEGMIVLDGNREIISANNAAIELFGGKEIRHRLLSEVTDDKALLDCMDGVIDGRKMTAVLDVEGKKYRVFFSPVFENDVVSGAVMLMFDISEEMKTVEIRREFSANVSHELKTPLTTILGYSQLINNGIAREEDIKMFTGKIEHESARMITLIDDIIKLSRLDEGADEDEHVPVHLEESVKEAVSLLEEKAAERNITFNICGKGIVITGNPGQISEMIYNLCDNAIKYNKEGGSVTVTLTEDGFTVSDTGIGIPEDMQERVFERFFRVDKSRSKKVSGTGLGLSIVKHIALCHNGEITVESIPDEGTTFKVKFNRF